MDNIFVSVIMEIEQQFCLKWNNFQSNISDVFSTLLEKEVFSDVSIVCEGRILKAHKLLLSASSVYFENIFSSTQHNGHPILILKDVKYEVMKALLIFIYKGEVNVSQGDIQHFMIAAESLQIKVSPIFITELLYSFKYFFYPDLSNFNF